MLIKKKDMNFIYEDLKQITTNMKGILLFDNIKSENLL